VNKKKALYILVIITLFLRVPGILWGELHKPDYNVFEIDELQHVEIAIKFLKKIDPGFYPEVEIKGNSNNARGYGIQLAVLSFPFCKIFETDYSLFIILGRILSILYSVLLVILVFHISRWLFKNDLSAFFSALLLSIFDLNITYSHYCVPAISYLFWLYLSVFLVSRLYLTYLNSKSKYKEFLSSHYKLILLLSISLALVFAFKLDFLPFILFLGVLTLLAIKRKSKLNILILILLVCCVLIVIAFYSFTAFNYTIEDINYSFKILTDANRNTIETDNHLLYNPILYLIAIIVGTSFLVILLFIYSFSDIFFRKNTQVLKDSKISISIFSIFLIMEFGLLWMMDATFVRRASVFLPFIAIIGGYGINKLITGTNRFSTLFKYIARIILIFTFLHSISSQLNFVNDTRYKAREFLNKAEFNDLTFAYYNYTFIYGMPPKSNNIDKKIDIIAMHESYYRRYWRSFTTPFKVPECCGEVYHCNQQHCEQIQKMFRGETDYTLIKSFKTNTIFPEKVLFKKYFGTYEDFLGDVLIYQRQ